MFLSKIFKRQSFANIPKFKGLTRAKSTEPHKHFARKIFSGIQPTGDVHLGNYLGAITQWVQLQNDGENVTYSIVDLHSITLPQDPKELARNILQMTATLLACGVDPDKSILFQQSYVPQHTELCWNLGCISTMARLSHLPQFKEKSATLKEVPLGLFMYPVLQAADILLYKATHVPVGEDQLQHLELCKELAKMFNKRYGQTFPIPQVLICNKEASRVKSLRDPTKKMSKSDPDAKSRICLTDTDDQIVQKVKKAVTDSTSKITYDPEQRPGVSNLINIHSLLTGKTPEDICQEAEDMDTLKYKHHVAAVVIDHISPIRQEITRLFTDPGYLSRILKHGADKAGEIADKTSQEVKNKLGMELKVYKEPVEFFINY